MRRILPISIECKNQERWNIHEFVKQAQEQAYENTEWVVIVKRNYQKDPYVIISWEFFKVLIYSLINKELD